MISHERREASDGHDGTRTSASGSELSSATAAMRLAAEPAGTAVITATMPAIDHEVRAGGASGALAGENDDQVGDLLGAGEAPGDHLVSCRPRDRRRVTTLFVSDGGGDPVIAEPESGGDGARAYRVDADASGPELL